MTDVSFTPLRDSGGQDASQPNGGVFPLTSRVEPTPYPAREGHPFGEEYAYELEGSGDTRSNLLVRRPSSFAGVNETWDDYTNVDARIVEVGEDWVRLDCLVDSENQVFQERTFQRRLLEGALPVRTGAYVLIRIFTSPGKIKHTFTDGEKYVRKEFFEDDSWFVDLEDAGLDEMLR